MEKVGKVLLEMSKKDKLVGYLYLPEHPKHLIQGVVKKTISVADVIPLYKGLPLYFDFNEEGELIGIEISG